MAGRWGLAVAIILELQAVVFTHIDGWDGSHFFGEEVRKSWPRCAARDFGSVFTIMGIYAASHAAVLYVLPNERNRRNKFALGTVAARVFATMGDPIIRSIMVIPFELSQLNSFLHANALTR